MRRAAVLAVLIGLATGGCGLEPDGPGTRRNPTPVGTAAVIGDYSVAFGPTTVDASEVVASTSPENASPPPGRQYVLAPVRFTYTGEGGGDPWVDLDIRFVSDAGVAFGRSADDGCGEVPVPLSSVGFLESGSSASADICVAVPVDEVAGGQWFAQEEGERIGWTGFFEAGS